MKNPDEDKTIRELIADVRANGYDAELESTLAHPWECPHCKFRCTIQSVLICLERPELDEACPACKREGIAPVDTDPPELGIIKGGRP